MAETVRIGSGSDSTAAKGAKRELLEEKAKHRKLLRRHENHINVERDQ